MLLEESSDNEVFQAPLKEEYDFDEDPPTPFPHETINERFQGDETSEATGSHLVQSKIQQNTPEHFKNHSVTVVIFLHHVVANFSGLR